MRHGIRRIAQGAVWVFATAVASHAMSQGYPNKPIRVVVTMSAGGTVDTLARALGRQLTESLAKPVIIDNRVGANGNIGADLVAKAPSDGYTLMIPDLGTLTAGPAVYLALPFDPIKDFEPITMLISSPYGFAAYPGLPVSSIKELIAYAKSNPGKLNYATLGTGSASHLAAIELAARAGVSWTYIPYKGSAAAVPDIAAGNAQVTCFGVSGVIRHVQSGKVRLLAVSSRERLSFLPDVPTVIEAGYPGYVVAFWSALLAPKGTPKDVTAKLHTESVRIMSTPEMKKLFAELATEVMTSTPDELRRFIISEKARWDKVAKSAGVKIE